ncbi:response regulator transcription factor [Enterococcus sp. 669A]|uniref:Response regulator transcription factor n=1 Tax=Candidatus Enterococcus moelleringii TaxID=2815325 RepID=A0ABS3L9Z9_9ENTE|nr:LytTR family DNA-binding domain-containing protein [Enterococcus sp. 669A]MBO1306458.1 response regulator transcription factor [Enterococcus sp. 669A]
MINIIICEDEKCYRDQVKEMLVKMAFSLDIEIQTECYCSAEEMLAAYENREKSYELMIFDIEMPGCDGLQAGKIIREQYQYDGQLVYLTSHAELMQDSFEIGTNQYLVKPIEYKEFEAKLRPIIKKIIDNDKRITVELVAGGLQIIPMKDITTIQAKSQGRKGGVIIQTTRELIEAFGKMADFENMLEKRKFFRIHKQTIINLDKITQFDGVEATTVDQQRYKVSRNKKRELKDLLLRNF